jgi:hypothetical protein
LKIFVLFSPSFCNSRERDGWKSVEQDLKISGAEKSGIHYQDMTSVYREEYTQKRKANPYDTTQPGRAEGAYPDILPLVGVVVVELDGRNMNCSPLLSTGSSSLLHTCERTQQPRFNCRIWV